MRRGAAAAVAFAVIAAAAAGAPSASADITPGQGGSQGGSGNRIGGGSHNGDLYAMIRWAQEKNGDGPHAAAPTPVGTWKPPACWYGPRYTPEEFQEVGRRIVYTLHHVPDAQRELQHFEDTYIEGHPWKNYNLDKQGKGYWWDSYYDPDQASDPFSAGCDRLWFWVDKGKPPPPYKNALTDEVLAGLAYKKLRIPQGKASMAPDGRQTVNLPTWMWMDKGRFHRVSVSAYVDAIGLWATTTAKPVSLHLDPGTPDARVHPGSGDCPINDDGSLGTPYTKGHADEEPPCGVTYLRPNIGKEPYPLKATVKWEISWTGSGHPDPQALAPGTFDATTPVTVREVQTVVR